MRTPNSRRYFVLWSTLFCILLPGQVFGRSMSEAEFLKALIQSNSLDLKSSPQNLKASTISVQGLDITDGEVDGLNNSIVEVSCDPRNLDASREQMDRLSTKQWISQTKKFFSRCHEQFEKGSWLGPASLVKYFNTNYPFLASSRVKTLLIPLSGGRKIPATLAMKESGRSRPLVVVKAGVFSTSGEEPSLRNYMIHLFDQSPFNVLLVSNQTGMDYLYQNKYVSLGGWSEGQETIEIAQWLYSQPDIGPTISSLHLMGISLGGNAAVYGAYYNDLNLNPLTTQKYYNSVTAICPVISLKRTLEKLYSHKLVGPLFYSNTRDHYAEASKYLTDVPDLTRAEAFPAKEKMSDYIGHVAAVSLNRRGLASINGESFLRLNNFWNLTKKVNTPTLVWASKDDMVVNNEVNAEVFEHDDYYESASNTGTLNFEHGNHCAFSAAYGFQASSSVLRNFVLKHSPEFAVYNYQERSWNFDQPHLKAWQKHATQIWSFKKGHSSANLKFIYFDKWLAPECEKASYFEAPSICYLEKDVTIPVSQLKDIGAKIPNTVLDAQTMTREFNTRVRIYSSSGTASIPASGTSSNKLKLYWYNY